ncbi:hypothetical protein F0562_014317 [Nyssa sinensis]|uniref:At1g61900-like C-terminal domain-containing protein n=1 Tax=Nyssa sinensis TaxID=561372 RepID=A0A5J4ZSL9_9ASTE|nr:hypothetical protein F0562_014317 [Nyssa sinensis]
MAKGRKLTTSRSERFLGGYSYGQGQGTVADVSELGEEDVWSIVDDRVSGDDHSTNGSHGDCSPRATTESNGGVSIRSRRRVSGGERHVGGLSLAFDDSGKTATSRIVHQFRAQDSVASPRSHHMATSAPVNVPDWSKIYRVNSVDSMHESDDGVDDQDGEMVPPHEYLAREYARSRNMAAYSVFEGVGRTLKGRDMSRMSLKYGSGAGMREDVAQSLNLNLPIVFLLFLCLHESCCSPLNYMISSVIMNKRADTLLPEMSPSAAPLPLLAPSPLTPFTNNTVPKLSGHCMLNFAAVESVMSMTSIDCLAVFAPFLANNAISEAARELALKTYDLSRIVGSHALSDHSTRVTDCKSIVLRWLASKLDPSHAKDVLRGLANCNVNKVCPLVFPNIKHVTKGCGNGISNLTACCNAMEGYVSRLQKQSFITNLQALDCTASLGMKLQKANITKNVYRLCRISLKDFSLQVGAQESGCLLPSLPSDATFDNSSGVSFHCDLNDNIPAPWPAGSQLPASSCNKTVKIPALPAATSGQSGLYNKDFLFLLKFAALVIFMILL